MELTLLSGSSLGDYQGIKRYHANMKEIKENKEVLKNNKTVACVAVVLGSKERPENNKLLFKAYMPEWKMFFQVGWELKDCICLAIPWEYQDYRYYVVRDFVKMVNSNEEYYCLFVSYESQQSPW